MRTALLACCLAAIGTPAAAKPLTEAECVKIALTSAPKIDEAKAKLEQYEARLAQVESIYYPKLMGMAFVAPMFTVRGDIFGVEREWKSIKDWGPYTYLQATLAQPIYTFGRVEAGKEAAGERAKVEEARVREAENTVALEVRRMYYARLYALSMVPSLQSAFTTVSKALTTANEMFEEGSGDVTQTDLNKLVYGKSEVEKYLIIAKESADLAQAALKHTMGISDSETIELAESVLPNLPDAASDAELAKLLVTAAEQRPEWDMLTHGKRAALALEDAEKLANTPVIFLAGQFTGSWTPTRDDAKNPYHYDVYNDRFGGVALGAQFNLDPWQASAKADEARGISDEVAALSRFAASGIPLQVRKAHGEVLRYRRLVGISDEGVTATRKWMTFAAAAYGTGTGEARDVLEGLVAYLQSRKSFFENVYNFYIAKAELDYAVGNH
jgi:outer membrane protein